MNKILATIMICCATHSSAQTLEGKISVNSPSPVNVMLGTNVSFYPGEEIMIQLSENQTVNINPYIGQEEVCTRILGIAVDCEYVPKPINDYRKPSQLEIRFSTQSAGNNPSLIQSENYTNGLKINIPANVHYFGEKVTLLAFISNSGIDRNLSVGSFLATITIDDGGRINQLSSYLNSLRTSGRFTLDNIKAALNDRLFSSYSERITSSILNIVESIKSTGNFNQGEISDIVRFLYNSSPAINPTLTKHMIDVLLIEQNLEAAIAAAKKNIGSLLNEPRTMNRDKTLGELYTLLAKAYFDKNAMPNSIKINNAIVSYEKSMEYFNTSLQYEQMTDALFDAVDLLKLRNTLSSLKKAKVLIESHKNIFQPIYPKFLGSAIGFFDQEGQQVFNSTFDDGLPFNGKNNLTTAKQNGKWGLIDKSGKILIKFTSEIPIIPDTSLNIIVKENGDYFSVDISGVKKGKIDLPLHNYHYGAGMLVPNMIGSGKAFSVGSGQKYDEALFLPGLHHWYVKQNGNVGVIDANGKVIVPLQYKWIQQHASDAGVFYFCADTDIFVAAPTSMRILDRFGNNLFSSRNFTITGADSKHLYGFQVISQSQGQTFKLTEDGTHTTIHTFQLDRRFQVYCDLLLRETSNGSNKWRVFNGLGAGTELSSTVASIHPNTPFFGFFSSSVPSLVPMYNIVSYASSIDRVSYIVNNGTKFGFVNNQFNQFSGFVYDGVSGTRSPDHFICFQNNKYGLVGIENNKITELKYTTMEEEVAMPSYFTNIFNFTDPEKKSRSFAMNYFRATTSDSCFLIAPTGEIFFKDVIQDRFDVSLPMHYPYVYKYEFPNQPSRLYNAKTKSFLKFDDADRSWVKEGKSWYMVDGNLNKINDEKYDSVNTTFSSAVTVLYKNGKVGMQTGDTEVFKPEFDRIFPFFDVIPLSLLKTFVDDPDNTPDDPVKDFAFILMDRLNTLALFALDPITTFYYKKGNEYGLLNTSGKIVHKF